MSWTRMQPTFIRQSSWGESQDPLLDRGEKLLEEGQSIRHMPPACDQRNEY